MCFSKEKGRISDFSQKKAIHSLKAKITKLIGMNSDLSMKGKIKQIL